MRSKWNLALILLPGLAGWFWAAFVVRGTVWFWLFVFLALVWSGLVLAYWLRNSDTAREVEGVMAHVVERGELL